MTGPPERAWVEQAACRDQPTRRFTDPHDDADVRAALATCHQCPVRQPCLAAALAHRPEADVGIWGGTTALQRRQLRTGRQADGPVATDQTHEPTPTEASRNTNQTATMQHSDRRKVRQNGPPETILTLDEHGDYVSADGRVLIFSIHGKRPWALAIDDRFIAATRTVDQAHRIARATLHEARQLGRVASGPVRLGEPGRAGG